MARLSRLRRILEWKIISPDYRFARSFYKLLDRAGCAGCPLLRELDRLEDRLDASNRAQLRASGRIGFLLRLISASILEFVIIVLVVAGPTSAIWGGQPPPWVYFSEVVVGSVLYALLMHITVHRFCRYEIRRELFVRGVPICPECEYDLRGINPPRCPECGASLERPKPQSKLDPDSPKSR